MTGVGALHDGETAGRCRHRRAQLLLCARERAVGEGLSAAQGEQHLLQKPLVIHVFAGLGEPLRCPLLGAEKEIVHVENAAIQILLQPRGQRGLAGAAPPVDGHDHPFLPYLQLLYAPEQAGIVVVCHTGSWEAVGQTKRCREWFFMVCVSFLFVARQSGLPRAFGGADMTGAPARLLSAGRFKRTTRVFKMQSQICTILL